MLKDLKSLLKPKNLVLALVALVLFLILKQVSPMLLEMLSAAPKGTDDAGSSGSLEGAGESLTGAPLATPPPAPPAMDKERAEGACSSTGCGSKKGPKPDATSGVLGFDPAGGLSTLGAKLSNALA